MYNIIIYNTRTHCRVLAVHGMDSLCRLFQKKGKLIMKFRIKVKRYLKFIFIESRYLWMILAIFSAPFFILAAYQKPLVTCNQIGMSSGCNDAVGVGDVNTNKKERNAAIILVTGLLMWLFLIYDYILKRGWWDKSHIEMVNENNEVKRRI